MPHGVGVPLCIMQMREYVCVGGRRADIQACAKVTLHKLNRRFDWQKNLHFYPPLVFTLFSN